MVVPEKYSFAEWNIYRIGNLTLRSAVGGGMPRQTLAKIQNGFVNRGQSRMPESEKYPEDMCGKRPARLSIIQAVGCDCGLE